MKTRNLITNSIVLIVALAIVLPSTCFGQLVQPEIEHEHPTEVFNLKWKREATLIGTGLTMVFSGAYFISKIEEPSLSDILALDKTTLWKIDRGATDNISEATRQLTDVLLYSAISLPLWMCATKQAKGEVAESLVMMAETMLFAGGATFLAKGLSKRYRPLAYNPNVEEAAKLKSSTRFSFFSGHVATTSALSFLTAQILNDLHPHWKARKIISWTTAVILPLVVGYGRYASGKHFPTDIFAGYVIGSAVGLIVPRLHRNKNFKLKVGPTQLSMSYQLNGNKTLSSPLEWY